MDGLPSKKKDWVVTRESFDEFLAGLDADREQAGKKYETIRQMLIFYFERHGCSTAVEQTDKTINRVIRKLEEGEVIRNLSAFCYGVARNVLREHWNDPGRRQAEPDASSQYHAFATDPRKLEIEREASEQSKQQFECMRQCLQDLPPEDRELITQHCTVESKEKLAEQMGMKLNALRVKAHRIRVKLKKCAADCLKTSKG